MSLQIWLPLISDIKNQGISDTTMTNTGGTANSSGKLGGCYYFDGSSYLQSDTTIGSGWTSCSISCWVKVASYTSGSWYRICGIGDHTRYHIDFASNQTIRFFASVDGTTTSYSAVSTTAVTDGEWHHVCGTTDGSTISIYLDGVLASSTSCTTPTSTSAGYFRVASINNGNKLNGYMNDVRLYNECLSPMQVKQISQGLVVHLPLNRGGFGLDNIIHDSANMSTSIWGYGASASLENAEDGSHVVKLTGTSANWSSMIATPRGNSDTSYLIPYSSVQNNKVTFSVDIKGNSSFTQGITFSLRTSSATGRTKYYTAGTVAVTTEWQRKSITVDIADNKFTSGSGTISSSDYFFIEIYNHVDDRNVWVKNYKLEYGNKATPWCPNSADTLYSQMGLDDGIEYDVSGYSHNGTTTNITYSPDTPKYSVSSVFDGSTSFIACGRGGMVKDAITVALWVYHDTWVASRPVSCTEGGGFTFEGTNVTFTCGTGASSNTYKNAASSTAWTSLSSGWHHFVGTYDGYSIKLYIDGVLSKTTTPYTTKTPLYYNANNGIFIGAEAGGNATTPVGTYQNQQVSDFRIYATTLSADDVMALYKNAAYVDSSGNIYASEYQEV